MIPSGAPAPAAPALPPPAPLFLPVAGQGARFGLYHAPAGPCTAALVYLHPFAEEMNRSRRMAALAARALAAHGVAVLQVDLLGCGDSSGDFGDARWDAWRADVARAVAWLHQRSGHVPGLWGLRVGALLALDCARDYACPRLLLWQPVHSGATCLTQFLRLQLAADMLDQQQAARNSTAALRAALRAGTPLEIAGYTLAPVLADALDMLDSRQLTPPCPVHWLEVAPQADRPLPPAAAAVLQAWQARGVAVQAHVVEGPPFWGTPEIAISPALVAATVAAVATHRDGHAQAPQYEPPHEARNECQHSPLREPCRELALAFACGTATVPAILTLPEQPGPRGVLVIVGGPQYRAGSHRQFTLLARSLAAQGIPVMRFDARGMGDGEGPQRTFDDIGDDVRAAVDCFMQAVPDLRDVVLWGLCDGAAAAVLYGGGDPRISGLVLLNPWARDEAGLAQAMLKHYYLRRLTDPALWRKVLSGRFDVRGSAASLAAHIVKAVRRTPPADAGSAGTSAGAGAQPGVAATTPVARQAAAPAVAPATLPSAPLAPAVAAAPLGPRLYDGLQRFPGPVLVVLSPGDMTAMEFLDLAGSSKAWRKLMQAPRMTRRDLPGADHTFSSREWRDQVAEWTGQWLRTW